MMQRSIFILLNLLGIIYFSGFRNYFSISFFGGGGRLKNNSDGFSFILSENDCRFSIVTRRFSMALSMLAVVDSRLAKTFVVCFPATKVSTALVVFFN